MTEINSRIHDREVLGQMNNCQFMEEPCTTESVILTFVP
jgi:hypothetical protein